MEEWKEYKLEEIGTIVGGATPSTKEPHNYNGNISWITPKDLSNNSGRYISRGERMITSEGFSSCSCKMLPKGSVLFSSRAPIGYVAIASNELCTNQGFKSIIPDEQFVDSTFLYYLLVYNKALIEGLGSGTTFKEVSGNVMKNVVVKIPCLKIQKQIANVLSSIDDKIEVNRRINDNFCYAFFEVILIWLLTSLKNDNLEQQAQSLFKSWFVDFEPFRNQPFVESELGMIPEGWRVLVFKDFIETSTEKAPVDSLPEYSVTNNGIIPREAKFNKKLSKYSSMNKVLRKDNLVFGMSREILNWGIMEDEIGGVSSAYNIYKLNQQLVSPTYLRLYMRARISDFNSLIGTAAREGQSLDKGQLMQKQIYIPSEKVLQDFFDIYRPITKAKRHVSDETRRISSLRDTLLPRLMSGELKVNEVEYAI